MNISKIVITGGPCAGKTTAMSWIQNAFTERGYKVIFVPETATELIKGGVTPWECASNLKYQVCQMQLQMEKERIFEQGAQSMGREKVLIVCDRGTMDNRAYMTEEEFELIRKELGVDEVHLRESYDAVFHLVTAAKGAEMFYTLENNQARTETKDQARVMDDKLLAAWAGHPHLRLIDNSSDFEEKMRRLVAEISLFLGEPEPYEIERKFLIEYPDVAWLERIPNCQRVEIIQTYLNVDPDHEVRIRQRGLKGNYTYYETIKKKISGLKRIETERRLSEKEYLRLLMEADTRQKQIRKTRYCLVYENQYFEIDLYPFWKDQAIVEIELRDAEQQIQMPEELKVIREVTEEAEYKNAALAVSVQPKG